MNKISRYFYFAACFMLLVYATLYVSDFVVNQLLHGFSYGNQILSLDYVKNTGAAFSILKDSREILIIVSVAAVCAIISYVARHITQLSMMSLFFWAMFAAGISGNLHERIAFGYVRDYIQLNFINFPVFNLADIFINIGVIALIIILLKNKL